LFTKITVILDKSILTISPPGYNHRKKRGQEKGSGAFISSSVFPFASL